MRIDLPKKPGSTRPRRTQEERWRTTQQAILEAAIAVLVKEGYAGFSTITVARRAGVSRGAREYYFRTKYDLIAAAWCAGLPDRGRQRAARA
jgi:AcrR family transcriptional regulator